MGTLLSILLVFFVIYLSLTDKTEKENKIEIEDINVGDTIKIKGENFLVSEYGSNCVMKLKKLANCSTKSNELIIDFGNDIEFISHDIDGKRQFIEVKGFKGTVGGEYLNKLKTK